jgi:hypothetical protein
MRGIDIKLAIEVRKHWLGLETSNKQLCPLLADLDRLLVYLDEVGIKPGNVIDPCPECGQEHRWALLKILMIDALEIRPDRQSRLMAMVDESLEPVRALYGGKEGYPSTSDHSVTTLAG